MKTVEFNFCRLKQNRKKWWWRWWWWWST